MESSEPARTLSPQISRTGQSAPPDYELQFLRTDRIRLTPLVSYAFASGGIPVPKRAVEGDQQTRIPLIEPVESVAPGSTTATH